MTAAFGAFRNSTTSEGSGAGGRPPVYVSELVSE
jgi:hypothetical protein